MTPTIYQVRDWQNHFENDRSRSREKCRFVCVPNKQHGMGFSRVMAEPDGAAIYGIFHLIVGAISQQPRRHGLLTANGEWTGSAWGVDDLALKFRRPEKEIERALFVLSSDKVAWIICHNDKCLCEQCMARSRDEFDALTADSPPTHRVVTVKSPPTAPEGKGIEGKGRGGNGSEGDVPPEDASLAEMKEAKRRIGSMYGRDADFVWPHSEESMLAELVRERKGWRDEHAEIEAFRLTIKPEDLKYDFPRSVMRLVEKWTSVLDAAKAQEKPARATPAETEAKRNWQEWSNEQLCPGKKFTSKAGPQRSDFPEGDSGQSRFDSCTYLYENWLQAGAKHRK